MTSQQERLDAYFRTVIQSAGFTPEGGRFYLERLFRGIDLTGKRVLDIGGGRGVFSYYAACMGAAQVVCLEPQGAGGKSDMHAIFAETGRQLPGLDNIRLEVDTIQNYDPGDDDFDVILMHASINHIDEDACIRLHTDEAAREVYRGIFRKIAGMCAPGGHLIAADVSRLNFFGHLGVKNPLAPYIEWHKHQPPSLWARLLADAGFVNPRVSWQNRKRGHRLIRALLDNPVAAYFETSYFCLTMDRA